MATPTKAEITKEAAKCRMMAASLSITEQNLALFKLSNIGIEEIKAYLEKRADDLMKTVSPATLVKQRIR